MSLKIIPYESRYAASFRDLNLAWLEMYFHVEEKDRLLLENCEETIIAPGGHIFLALLDDAVVGCFALIKLRDGQYELGKMAVNPSFQGRRIGQELLHHAVEFARAQGWEKITLYSSTRLPTALYIYRKFGFKEVELEKELPYLRSDIKMELPLNHLNIKPVKS